MARAAANSRVGAQRALMVGLLSGPVPGCAIAGISTVVRNIYFFPEHYR